MRVCGVADALDLARVLHGVYQQSHAGDPGRAAAATASLDALAACMDDAEITALATWTSGMAAVHLDGRMERGVALLGEAAARFSHLGRPLDAAATQVSRLQALAMLGRYEEAVACGLEARDTFENGGDLLATGKIEQNLGNIAYRRARFHEAETWYRAARTRYILLGNEPQLAQIDNNLGMVLSDQHRFTDAWAAFEQALERAERSAQEVTRTEVQYNLGCLALFRGQYDRALDRLETARRTYAQLHMPHRSARVELELTDAYLELNLAPEAASLAARLTRTFTELGMRAERARAVGCHGRAVARLGQSELARTLLAQASDLYTAEGNVVDAAFLTLVEAQLLYTEGEFEAAAEAAQRSEAPLVAAHMWGRSLLARWLRGEALRAASHTDSLILLESALEVARERDLPQIAYRCLTSLGLVAAAAGDTAAAERRFEESLTVIETLRAPLPAEDFRVAFMADKLTPFSELVRVSLGSASPERATRALEYVERGRSRALVDMLAGVVNVRSRPRDAYEKDQLQQLEGLREELQWFYSQINRSDGASAHAPEAVERLYAAVRERESRVIEIRHRIEQQGGAVPDRMAPLHMRHLQDQLGSHTALIEYFSLDGDLLAFVVTDEHISVVEHLGTESDLEQTVGRLRSQMDTVRHGGRFVEQHSAQLLERTRHHLHDLYGKLLAPLERYVSDRRLAIVPHRFLHYVPFHALYDGNQYVVESRSMSYAPSATVLSHCIDKAAPRLERALLIGVADAQAPRVRDEVAAIAQLLSGATVRFGAEATLAEVRSLAPDADLLHMACHAQFRPDNPLFSALRLGDGWMTVGDAYELDLHCGLVILSACETGVNAVAPGEELVGLARGFFSAGTRSLMVSLWTVDDESTAELMTLVYQGLRTGLGAADALAAAQRDLMQRYPHPYYWSPFFVLGQW